MSLSDIEVESDEVESCPPKFLRQRSRSDVSLVTAVHALRMTKMPCVYLLKNPSVINFCQLRKVLKHTKNKCMAEFLRHDGLELLFECLNNLGRYPGRFANLVLMLECVMCIRTVMNSSLGLECLIGRHCQQGFAKGKTC